MTKDECITLLKKYTGILKEKYGITSLSLFGSTARGEQKEGSDIDLFVDTETPNPFLLMDAKGFLEDATGSSVDIIRNHQNLNPRLRKRILKDGIFIFWKQKHRLGYSRRFEWFGTGWKIGFTVTRKLLFHSAFSVTLVFCILSYFRFLYTKSKLMLILAHFSPFSAL